MNQISKIFATLFLVFQSLVIFQLLPKHIDYDSYAAEVMTVVLLKISKINHAYNFFTSKSNSGEYSYSSTNITMFKSIDDRLEILPISQKGSITHLVNPVNISRVSHLESLASSDTLLYNAVVRSKAMHFFQKHPSYPIINIEVLKHNNKVKVIGNKFFKEVKVDTVYSNYFTME